MAHVVHKVPLIHLRQDAIIFVDGNALQRGVERDALVRRLFPDSDHHVDVSMKRPRIRSRPALRTTGGFTMRGPL